MDEVIEVTVVLEGPVYAAVGNGTVCEVFDLFGIE